jgi:hypothetical protein
MSEKQTHDISHVEANGNFDRSWRDEKWGNRSLSVAAQDVASQEKEMTIWQAVQANPMAIFWSLVISTCVIMEGYDTNLLGNFYAYRELPVSFEVNGHGLLNFFFQPRSSESMATSLECQSRLPAGTSSRPAGSLALVRRPVLVLSSVPF